MISLFAVITAFPFFSNASIYSFPGSIPPRTSMTKSIESSFKISSKLSVNKSFEISRALFVSRTKIFLTFNPTIPLSKSIRRATTAEPILPAPKTATLNELFSIFSKDKCYLI